VAVTASDISPAPAIDDHVAHPVVPRSVAGGCPIVARGVAGNYRGGPGVTVARNRLCVATTVGRAAVHDRTAVAAGFNVITPAASEPAGLTGGGRSQRHAHRSRKGYNQSHELRHCKTPVKKGFGTLIPQANSASR